MTTDPKRGFDKLRSGDWPARGSTLHHQSCGTQIWIWNPSPAFSAVGSWASWSFSINLQKACCPVGSHIVVPLTWANDLLWEEATPWMRPQCTWCRKEGWGPLWMTARWGGGPNTQRHRTAWRRGNSEGLGPVSSGPSSVCHWSPDPNLLLF